MEPGSSPTITPAVFFETEFPTFAPLASSACGRLVARERLERAGDHVGLAGERALDRLQLVAGLEAQTELAELLDELPVLLVGEPFGDRLGSVRPDALDLLDLLLASRS